MPHQSLQSFQLGEIRPHSQGCPRQPWSVYTSGSPDKPFYQSSSAFLPRPAAKICQPQDPHWLGRSVAGDEQKEGTYLQLCPLYHMVVVADTIGGFAETARTCIPRSGVWKAWDHENGINNNLSVLWKSLRRIVVSHRSAGSQTCLCRICQSGPRRCG